MLSGVKRSDFSAWRASIVKRYATNSEFVFEDCLVALSVHDAVISVV